MSLPAGPALTSTLILALSQSEALQRQLEESTQTIERLKRENEKLKQQLDELRQARPRTDGPDLVAQLDHLFRKDAEKQAEIDSLRKTLAQKPHPNTSSPICVNASRKRARVNSRESRPLTEIAANSSPGDRRRHDTGPKALRGDSAGPIAFVAEDGLDHNRVEGVVVSEEPTESNGSFNAPTNTSPNGRLQALLSTAAPAPAPLPTFTPRPLSARKTPLSTNRAPEDDEPLRSRPPHRLNLSHFKVNPKHSSGLPFAFQDIVRNKEARKCLPGCIKPECCGSIFTTLAKTLPQDTEMSEDELLLGFLGPGSEEKIKGLTPLARTNLVHEAKAKRLANLYGRMHRTNYDIPSSPPGYWEVEIEATQQNLDNREHAKLKEREEVERRFQEAMNGGRWLFADE